MLYINQKIAEERPTRIILFLSFLIINTFSLGNDAYNLYDLTRVKSRNRKPHSKIIQFCFNSNNIGDHLPTLGIRFMLKHTPDIWDTAYPDVDFNFVNKHYKCGIIGGAGLLHPAQERFWKKVAEECKIPLIIWGVGLCLPSKIADVQGVSRNIVHKVAQKCDLINFRDTLTAQYYGLKKAYVAPCPCIVYLQKFNILKKPLYTLYSSHEGLVPFYENQEIEATISNYVNDPAKNFKVTHNTKKNMSDIDAIIKDHYCKSAIVITTRLHGAIIAYALGIPYIILAYDKKLLGFHKDFGNGIVAQDLNDLKNILKVQIPPKLKKIKMDDILTFGYHATQWVTKQLKK